jgi:hypothetical protein
MAHGSCQSDMAGIQPQAGLKEHIPSAEIEAGCTDMAVGASHIPHHNVIARSFRIFL